MLDQALRTTGLVLDKDTLEGLIVQPSAPVSDAPGPSMIGGGAFLLGLGLSPKEPKGR